MSAVLEVPSPELIQADPGEAVRLGAENLILYGRLFFPRTFRQPSPQMHYEMGLGLYSTRRYQAWKIARDFAKTSLLRVYTSQRIAYDISHTIQYISSSQEHSKYSVRWMRRQVMFNKRWASLFGLVPDAPWTDELAVIRNTITNTFVTLMALGVTGQVRGFNPDDYRPDLIILDDVLTDENAATEEQRKKINSLVFGAILNSLAPETEAPHAKLVAAQTPLAKGDAIDVMDKDPAFHTVTYGVFDEQGASRWPERYPVEVLLREKASATRKGLLQVWMREKECKIIAGETQALNSERFRFYDVLPEHFDDIVMAIDPASSDSPTAADTAQVVLGFLGADVYILEFRAAKGMMPDAVSHDFFSMAMFWRPRKVCIETVAYQKILAWYLERDMKLKRFFVVVDQVIDKRRKDDRILQDFGSLLHTGHVYIKPSMNKLINQCNDYIPGSDCLKDIIDAVAMGIVGGNPALRALLGEEAEDNVRIYENEEDEDFEHGAFRGAP